MFLDINYIHILGKTLSNCSSPHWALFVFWTSRSAGPRRFLGPGGSRVWLAWMAGVETGAAIGEVWMMISTPATGVRLRHLNSFRVTGIIRHVLILKWKRLKTRGIVLHFFRCLFEVRKSLWFSWGLDRASERIFREQWMTAPPGDCHRKNPGDCFASAKVPGLK